MALSLYFQSSLGINLSLVIQIQEINDQNDLFCKQIVPQISEYDRAREHLQC